MTAQDWLLVRVGGFRFALETAAVRDVFTLRDITPTPRAPREVMGVLNLRGRIVTVICARRVLGLEDVPEGDAGRAVSFESDGDLYGLRVDAVDDVTAIDPATVLSPPASADRWAGVVDGLVRVEGDLVLLARPRAFVFPPAQGVPSEASAP